MSMREIKKDSTDQSVVIRIIDSSDGTPETAVEHNTAGIDLWYRREGATKTSITEAALAALDSAHNDGGIEHIGDGYYRLDLPDAAVATGANGVMVGGTVTGMIVIGCYVPLVDYDPYDSVRAGLTALPNAAADAAGGLPVSDAGGLDLDTKLENANEITAARMGALTDWIDGGRLDLILDIIAAAPEACSGTLALNTADTVFDLTATSGTLWGTDDDVPPQNMIICIYDNSGGIYETRRITNYEVLAGPIYRVTIDRNISFPCEDGVDTWVIYRAAYTPVGDASVSEADKNAIADKVWDEADADHISQGSKGQRLHHAVKGRY